MNHGTASIFTALRNNTKKTTLRDRADHAEISLVCGCDIDLERGGEFENRAAQMRFLRTFTVR